MDTTSWHVAGLDDNTAFFWRAKASDGYAESPWALGNFFVNTANDSPSIPTVKNPGQGAWVKTLTPTLELNPSVDVDNDSLIYQFEVYSDASLNTLVVEGESDTTGWMVSSELNDNLWYFWRSQTRDEHGATSGWMDTASFFVNNDGVDDPPEITVIEPSSDMVTNGNAVTITWEDTDPDSNSDIALYYDTDSFSEDGTLIVDGLKEDPDDGQSDSYLWDISGMSDGTYYIYITITDGTFSDTSYAQGAIAIDRTPPALVATPLGGTYTKTQSVTLSASEAADIYYTTDGSDPTMDSLPYTLPIEVTETTTIRFMAVDAANNESEVEAETYTIGVFVNIPPTADAGPDQTVDEGKTVTLNASNSSDPDDGIASYLWTQSAGTSVTLSDATAGKPSFLTPPVDASGTELAFQLTVTDERGLRATDEVSVTINDNGIAGFPDDVVTMTCSTGKNIGIIVKNGGSCTSLFAINPSVIADTTNRPENLIYGLFDMRIKVDSVGGTVELKFCLPIPAPDGYHWFKYSSADGWTEYSTHTAFNTARDEVALTLRDGGVGDDDGVANGVIVDPSGLGIAPAAGVPIDDGGGGGGGCFVATAAFGSPFERHVEVLREFRDVYLMPNGVGRAFVKAYYMHSPPVADFIAKHEGLRAVVRWSLLPFVGVSWMAVHFGLWWVPLSLLALMIVLLGATQVVALRRVRLRRP